MAADLFVPRDAADIVALVGQYPFAWVVSADAATPLPLLAETGADGAIVALFGHIARRNPQLASFERDRAATILFMGPQAYVPARLVSQPDWGPTWNYAVVRFEVEIEVVPDETIAAIERLALALEQDRADPWTPARMGPRYEELARYIVAFRAHVRSTTPRFKLGQDESPRIFDEIVAGLDDRALAAWMTRVVRA